MSDERVLGVMTPALPSRATGEAKPLTPLPTAGVDPATLLKVKKRRLRKVKVIPVKTTKQRKRIMKKAKKRVVGKHPALAAPYAKNPNRPLEAKNRLGTTIKVMATLAKAEVSILAELMVTLEDMAGPARKRVIEALGKVYA